MKRLQRLLCAGTLACLGLGCVPQGAAEITLDAALSLPANRAWDIHAARYTLFAKPPVGWVGDVMPMGGDADADEMRLFYLQDWRDGAPTYHPFHSFTTSDFVHYTYHGEAIPVTHTNDYDLALGTGSVTKIGDTYHAFYTGNNPLWFAQGKPREYIRHAVSEDLKTFVKLEEETFTSSAADGYDRENFRDPFLFWNEEKQEYWLLITAVRNGRAVVARCRSATLSEWEFMEPLLLPGTNSAECPDLFRWGDWWYCVFSTDWTTRYMRAPTLDGPWEHPPMPDFDSHAFYAAKTGVLGGQRYLCGWIGTRGGYSGEFSDTSPWDWAGNLCVYQLAQDEDGWLSIRLPDSVRAAFGAPEPLVGKAVAGDVEVLGDSVTIRGDRDGGGVVFAALPDEPALISAEITLHGDARAAGFSFGSDNYARALAVELDMKHGLLRYDNTVVSRTRYNADSSYISRRLDTKNRTYHVEVLLDNDIAVFFLNGREALSTRIYRMPQMPWGLYAAGGEATFANVTMRLLND